MLETILGIPLETFLIFLVIWATGGIFAILIIGSREKERLGKAFFSSLLSDKELLLIPMILGYVFYFCTSWISVILSYTCEKPDKKQ